MNPGFVSLVGAGPGDPELLTLKALRRIQQADVVVYDALVAEEILGYCAPWAELIFAGKRCGNHSMPQEGINELLVELGRAGKQVVRLKGGDPFIFGRGAEEAEALEDAGIAWEVVPGISSAVAAPAYAGIPLTYRKMASSCSIITGHEAIVGGRSADRLGGTSADTLVILMGIERIRQICTRLVEQGRDASTPVAVVQWGTTSRQRTILADLATIADSVASAGITAPAVIVVGEVSTCATRLAWFQRTEAQPELVQMLAA